MRTRLILSALAFIAVLSLLWLIQAQRRMIMRLNTDNGQLIKMANDSGRVARTYINLYNEEVSHNKVLELSMRNVGALRNTPELAFVKKFAGVNKKMNNLEETIKVQADVIARLKLSNHDTLAQTQNFASPQPDSIAGKSFTYGDEYNIINGLVLPDTTQLFVDIQVPIDGVVYWQKKHHFIFKNWRFGKKEYFSELSSPNKWVHISQHEFINVGRKR